jgi:dipeptidase E
MNSQPHVRILLGSGGFHTPSRLQFLHGELRSFFGPISSLLFIPYALHDHDRYLNTMIERGVNAGYNLVGIHQVADPIRAIQEADALFVGGGNTFRLLAALYRLNLLEPIRQRVRAGMPYLGISAGCNIACPTIKTTNDMPITEPPSLRALGLVPFQVNPHYFVGQTHVKLADGFQEHFGETRDERLREFHEMNDTPVLGMWEAGILRIENGIMLLRGADARLFRKGEEPVDMTPPGDLSFMLMN